MQLSAQNLSFRQATALTPFVTSLLRNIGITVDPELVCIDDACQWNISGDYELTEKEFLAQQLQILPLLNGATAFGPGPMAFYIAQLMGLTTRDIYQYCLTFDDFDKTTRDNLFVKVDSLNYDAIWGEIEISGMDPFILVTKVKTDQDIITIVQWKTKHFNGIEEYIQLRDRDLIDLGDIY